MLVLAKGSCGCLRLINVEVDALTGAYINQSSGYDPNANDYIPYINEDIDAYYVPEDYDGMTTPRKHSEDSTAPSLNGMALFVGIQDNGDGTYANYNFTPSQLITYILGQTNFDISKVGDGNTVTDSRFGDREVATVNDGQQTYNRGQFTQVGDTITMTNGTSFYNGQLLNFQLR